MATSFSAGSNPIGCILKVLGGSALFASLFALGMTFLR